MAKILVFQRWLYVKSRWQQKYGDIRQKRCDKREPFGRCAREQGGRKQREMHAYLVVTVDVGDGNKCYFGATSFGAIWKFKGKK